MFRFELTRKEDGHEVTTYGQFWDTRRDAAFHAMLAHKLTLAQFNHLTSDSHGPLPVTDGAMLSIGGKDTMPDKGGIDLGVWRVKDSYIQCKYCSSQWDGAAAFIRHLMKPDGKKCTYGSRCPSNQPGFNPNQPTPAARPAQPQVTQQWIPRPAPERSAAEIEDMLRPRPASGTFDPAYPEQPPFNPPAPDPDRGELDPPF